MSEEEKRFWQLVNKDGEVPAHKPEIGKCHQWIGGTFARAYAQFSYKGVNHRAARWIFQLKNGKLTTSEFILHECDNRMCVNLSHLRKGSHQDNVDDMVSKDRQSKKLSKEAVLYIRKSLADKTETINSLKEKFGVSFQAVYQVARGNQRKSVGGESIAKKSRVFTDEELLRIKNCPRTRGAAAKLAKLFGGHPSVVYHIRNGKRHGSK